MRTARDSKDTDRSGSRQGESAPTEELFAISASSVIDQPAWTTRANPTGISRVPTHAVRPTEERRAYSRATLSLPLRLKRIAGQRMNKYSTLRTTNISS